VAQNKKGELSKTIYSVAEVIGQVSGQSLKEHIQTACRAKGREAQIDRVELRHLPAAGEDDESEERRILLEDNGRFFFFPFPLVMTQAWRGSFLVFFLLMIALLL